ncbi:hypothetical protein U0355_08895 [Salimicrobium sp. PL1-032A]|uniref:hypothetical protein n=1 Tax=Salimicrobium sp. PL1-032A TaxID=3095364 RepID=UPI00325FF563
MFRATWIGWLSLLLNILGAIIFMSVMSGKGRNNFIFSIGSISTTIILAGITALIAILLHKGLGKWIGVLSFIFSLIGSTGLFLVIAVSGMGQPV